MKRNRIIGSVVVAFAAILVVPTLLSPAPEHVAKLKVRMVEDQTHSETVLRTLPASHAAQANISTSGQAVAVSLPSPTQVNVSHSSQPKKPDMIVTKSTPNFDKIRVVRPLTSGGELIQVASLSNRDNALNLVKKLKSDGLPAIIKEVTLDGKLYTRVIVGPYKSESASKRAKTKLLQLGYVK